ncbi:cytochrome P450 [Streptomyces armeniacus]|uniref:Cytochrome P450 n=1 Tax=Streptomyces armeniacus TaxID=83291 RepID=A0A345XPD1_9ACTN|nr:cytochrome P450 [Streptomyces armeniacus]AXK33497.1 cytochrome P450 [Streptomyces armeniacus]
MVTLAERWDLRPEHFWMRDRQPEKPVETDENGVLNVYGYAENLAVFADPKTYSSDVTRFFLGDTETDDSFNEGTLLQADPPEHTKLRKLISRSFTAKMVTGLEPRIESITREILDAADVDGRGGLDLVAELTYPMPVIVIAELLGVPSSDRELFRGWVDRMTDSATALASDEQSADAEEPDSQAAMRHVPEMLEYLHEHVAERRRKPREDLLSALIASEVDGKRLSDAAVVNFANELLVVGHATTSALLGNTVLCLDSHPEELARVREHPETAAAVVEEALRFMSPIAASYRVTTAATQLGGVEVGADQLVALWLGAANRDPGQFPDPHRFDPTRDPNPHLAFGRGIHFCLGAPLARLEGRLGLNILLERFPKLRTDPDSAPVFWELPHVIATSRLPLRVD